MRGKACKSKVKRVRSPLLNLVPLPSLSHNKTNLKRRERERERTRKKIWSTSFSLLSLLFLQVKTFLALVLLALIICDIYLPFRIYEKEKLDFFWNLSSNL